MTVSQGPASKGQKELLTKYPHEEGLILGTTKISGRSTTLKPQRKSLLRYQDRL